MSVYYSESRSEKEIKFQRPHKQELMIGANHKLTLADVKLINAHAVNIKLDPNAYLTINRSHDFLASCITKQMPIYGVNTNFGDQVKHLDHRKEEVDLAQSTYESISYRQENLIRSMACSLGSVIPAEVVRLSMVLRVHCLSQGYSGVSTTLIENILAFVNAGITPIVKSYGSIGASGDLIPLASIAAALMGEEVDVLYRGNVMKAPDAIQLAHIKPIQPKLRDGLAMINGTSFMTAIASTSLIHLKRLFKQMLRAIAMTLESMLVISSAYHPLVHQLKRQAGEMIVNDFLMECWQGSQLLSDLDELRDATRSVNEKQPKKVKPVQDCYSIRAVAQGFGPFYENLEHASRWIENEMNAVSDNPIIDAEREEILHAANFMGYYVTDACDILKIDISQASAWLHALLANLVHPRKNHDLPANLIADSGKNGFRSLQILTAALAVQNRKLAQSHQAFMIATEGDNQDVNSLGTHAAIDFQEAVANLERITAILLLAATQALEFRGMEKASHQAQSIAAIIREHSKPLVECRPMTEELESLVKLLRQEKF